VDYWLVYVVLCTCKLIDCVGSFIKDSAVIMDAHYPGRVSRLVIANAPFWFYSVWSKVIARVLPESVTKKISIISGVDGLAEFIEPDQRPGDYGGTGKPLGQSEEHLKFVEAGLTAIRNAASSPAQTSIQTNGQQQANNSRHTTSQASSGNGGRTPSSQEDNSTPSPGGFMGWMRNRMSSSSSTSSATTSSSTAVRGNAEPTNAYLGEKNLLVNAVKCCLVLVRG
jgi:hypothetical protein